MNTLERIGNTTLPKMGQKLRFELRERGKPSMLTWILTRSIFSGRSVYFRTSLSDWQSPKWWYFPGEISSVGTIRIDPRKDRASFGKWPILCFLNNVKKSLTTVRPRPLATTTLKKSFSNDELSEKSHLGSTLTNSSRFLNVLPGWSMITWLDELETASFSSGCTWRRLGIPKRWVVVPWHCLFRDFQINERASANSFARFLCSVRLLLKKENHRNILKGIYGKWLQYLQSFSTNTCPEIDSCRIVKKFHGIQWPTFYLF